MIERQCIVYKKKLLGISLNIYYNLLCTFCTEGHRIRKVHAVSERERDEAVTD